MEFNSQTLSNGLTIIGEVNRSAKSAAIGFFVKTGSRDETEKINGVSHFLEHMIFKGTDKLSALEVNQAFDRTGAQYNAFTSEENTVYYAAVLPEYLMEVTKLWIELMQPALRDDDFNIEKNVIKEEIAMYKDMPNYEVIDKCRSLHFQDHPCGRSVLGTEESIDQLTAEQMRQYFLKRYAPNNMVVALAGNFDWQQACQTLQDGCGHWRQQDVYRQLEHCPGSKKVERIEKPNLVCEHICLMSQAVPAQDPRRFAASLLATIIGDDVGSRFFWELVDKALAESASMQFAAMDGTGIFCSYFRCNSANAGKVLDVVRGIFEDVTREGVSEEELNKARNKVLSALVLKNELPMGRLVDLGTNWLYLGQYRSIEEDVEAIKAVTRDDVHSLIKEADLNSFTQFSIGPTPTG